MKKQGSKKKSHKPSPEKNAPKPNAKPTLTAATNNPQSDKKEASKPMKKGDVSNVAAAEAKDAAATTASKEAQQTGASVKPVGKKSESIGESRAEVVVVPPSPVEAVVEQQHETSEKNAAVAEPIATTADVQSTNVPKKKPKPNNKKKRLEEQQTLTQKVDSAKKSDEACSDSDAAEPPLVESIIVGSKVVTVSATDANAMHPLVRSVSVIADLHTKLVDTVLSASAAAAIAKEEIVKLAEAEKTAVEEMPKPKKISAVEETHGQMPTIQEADELELKQITMVSKSSASEETTEEKATVEKTTSNGQQTDVKPTALDEKASAEMVVEKPDKTVRKAATDGQPPKHDKQDERDEPVQVEKLKSTQTDEEHNSSANSSARQTSASERSGIALIAEHEKSQLSYISDIPSADLSTGTGNKEDSQTTASVQDAISTDDKDIQPASASAAADVGIESSENYSEHGGSCDSYHSRRFYHHHNNPYQQQDVFATARQLEQQQQNQHRQQFRQLQHNLSHQQNGNPNSLLHNPQFLHMQQQMPLQHHHQQQQQPTMHRLDIEPPSIIAGQHHHRQREIQVEKDFIFTRIAKYTPRSELTALEAVDYRYDDSLTRNEALLLRQILNFNDFTGPAEYAEHMALIIEIEDAFAQRDQWKHIKRQMAIVRKFRDCPTTVSHEWVNIKHERIPCFVDVGDRVLLTAGCGRRFGNSIREHQRNQLVNNVYATIVAKQDEELCIAPNSQLSDGTDYTMQYVLNRMNYQLERYALERLHQLQLAPLLFPVMDLTLSTVRAADMPPVQLIDGQLDDVQSLAVRAIVAGLHHPRPFVLSGVAGSGKTRCMVEAILQLYRTQPKSKLLITSAANNILDELLLTLHATAAIPDAAFLRLNSATAGHTDSGDNPLHSLIDPHDDVRAQRLARLSTCVSKINTPVIETAVTEARLVMCTLSVCGRIAMSSTELHNFTHIFVVKAEAANESTCLLPLCCLSGQPRRIDAHVILCGDTAQLGPIVKSPVAKRMHYGRSLIERLEGNPLYSAYEGLLSVRLRRNYRSLPELLELPNMLSYNGQMEAGVNYAQRLKSEHHITFAGYPIMFHSVENGQPVREPRSCSWSNVNEANIVIAYVYYYMDLGVSVDDIGIITPYKQQMRMIQKGIVDFAATPHRSRLRIGSSEEFQGREKKIVIVSTVRNNKLGFINSRKRINHMLTRATSLLIIVGNGDFLQNDASAENDWKDVIRHCQKHEGAYISTK